MFASAWDRLRDSRGTGDRLRGDGGGDLSNNDDTALRAKSSVPGVAGTVASTPAAAGDIRGKFRNALEMSSHTPHDEALAGNSSEQTSSRGVEAEKTDDVALNNSSVSTSPLGSRNECKVASKLSIKCSSC